jgi:hypothetical protein
LGRAPLGRKDQAEIKQTQKTAATSDRQRTQKALYRSFGLFGPIAGPKPTSWGGLDVRAGLIASPADELVELRAGVALGALLHLGIDIERHLGVGVAPPCPAT